MYIGIIFDQRRGVGCYNTNRLGSKTKINIPVGGGLKVAWNLWEKRGSLSSPSGAGNSGMGTGRYRVFGSTGK